MAAIAAVLAAGALAGCAATGTAATTSRTASVSASAAATVGHAAAALPRPSRKPKPTPTPRRRSPPRSRSRRRARPPSRRRGRSRARPTPRSRTSSTTSGSPSPPATRTTRKPAFFPEKAYEQVKAIADPDSDWQNRLWDEFALDVAAVHPLIGRNARLLKVIVPAQYAIWMPPGACYNNIGYWHVPGARVVYEQGRSHPLVRHHVADLLARRLVPGPPRRLQQDCAGRHRRRPGAGAGRARPARRLLAGRGPAG